jgi:hypothetical protein
MFTQESESMSPRIVLMGLAASLAVSPSRLPADDARRREGPDPRRPARPAGGRHGRMVTMVTLFAQTLT